MADVARTAGRSTLCRCLKLDIARWESNTWWYWLAGRASARP